MLVAWGGVRGKGWLVRRKLTGGGERGRYMLSLDRYAINM